MKKALRIFLFLLLFIIIKSTKINIIILLSEKNYPENNQKYFKEIVKKTNFQLEILQNNNNLIKSDIILAKIQEKDLSSLKFFLKKQNNTKIKTINIDRKIKINFLSNSKKFLPLNPDDTPPNFDYHISTKATEFMKTPQNINPNQLQAKNIKIGIFDTGISENYHKKHSKNIKEIISYTQEQFDTNDINGHGTFVTSILVNINNDCPGLIPKADLYIFKVFNHKEETYTSWLLEAFNYALHLQIDLINFSIGSIETPSSNEIFVEKIEELTRNKITIISAVGNDGPSFGSINTPADLLHVISVGSYDLQNEQISSFSSKGPTNNELPNLGRIKPDVLAPGKLILGADLDGNCVAKSGTSIATPLVTSAIAIVVGFLKENDRKVSINPGFIKRKIIENSDIVEEASIYEQGAGVINVTKILNNIEAEEKVSFFPEKLNFSNKNYYFYPISNQPFFANRLPSLFNLSLINSFENSVVSLNSYQWDSNIKDFINVEINIEKYNIFKHSYFAYFSITLQIFQDNNFNRNITNFLNIELNLNIYKETKLFQNKSITLTIIFDAIQTPPREKRIIWDQFHSLNFPQNGFIPRDSLSNFDYPCDWFGDSLFSNFLQIYNYLRNEGYYIDILTESFLCFNANNYKTLILIDTEKSFTKKEIQKLQMDIVTFGLSLVVFADWFDNGVINKSSFYDPFYKRNVKPIIGGANLPTLNSLLDNFGISFGNTVYSGNFPIQDTIISYYSGTTIKKFPKNGFLFPFTLFNESEIVVNGAKSLKKSDEVPILGILPEIFHYKNSGKIIVYGDSNCLDGLNLMNPCFWLLKDFLKYIEGQPIPLLSFYSHYGLPFDYIDNRTESIKYDEWIQESDSGKYFNKVHENDNDKCFKGEFHNFQDFNIENKKLIEETEFKLKTWSIEKNNLKKEKKNNEIDLINEDTNNQDDKVSIQNTIEFQIGIVIISFILVGFILILLKRKRRSLVSYEDINQDTILIV